MWKLFWDKDGAVAIYAGFVSTLVIGAGVLAFDFGKATVLKAQMQNAADAAVMSAALQLDGQTGARARSCNVAVNALAHNSTISDDASALTVLGGAGACTSPFTQGVRFYSAWNTATKTGTTATSDATTVFVEVILQAEQVTVVLQPILEAISSVSGAASLMTVGASAVATPAPIACDTSPFFVCNPNEPGAVGANPAYDILQPTNFNAGREMVIKEGPGGSTQAPGNFGLLCPDPSFGNCGASSIHDAIAALPSGLCNDIDTVDTAPGVRVNQIVNGINLRFNVSSNPVPASPPPPAKNIQGYTKDADIADVQDDHNPPMGDGNWSSAAYWAAEHGGAAIPGALPADPSRMQVWLYENNVPFCHCGKRTEQPVPSGGSADISKPCPVAGGWQCVTPPAEDIPPAAEVPGTNNPAPLSAPERRVVAVAVLNCEALNVQGSGTYPTFGQFVQLEITECSCSGNNCTSIGGKKVKGGGAGIGICDTSGSGNGDIYGEIIGPLTTITAGGIGGVGQVIANVRLID